MQDAIVAPLPSTSVQPHAADIQNMICGLPTSAQLAEVRGRFFPPLKVGCCGEGVDRGVEEKL